MIRKATNFKKQRNMPLNVIGPRLLEHFYIIKSGTSEKIFGYPLSTHFDVKNLFLF